MEIVVTPTGMAYNEGHLTYLQAGVKRRVALESFSPAERGLRQQEVHDQTSF